MKYAHVVRMVFDQPWAILPSKLAAITDFVRFKAEGGELTEAEVQAAIGAALPRGPRPTGGAVAVIPVYGVINQRMNMMAEISGGTSTELIGRAVRDAVADSQVRAIVLDIDSPGGGVYGVAELAAEIYAARQTKPIVAVANSMAASAAYWLGTAASDLAVTPSGEVGSIGVYTAHQDQSLYEEREGLKTTLISAGKYKTEGNYHEPLSDEARAAMQGRVDDYYRMFTEDVARHRGVSVADVRNGFGQGRMVGAREAVKLGMADRVATVSETVRRLLGSSAASGARAEEWEEAISAEGMKAAEALAALAEQPLEPEPVGHYRRFFKGR